MRVALIACFALVLSSFSATSAKGMGFVGVMGGMALPLNSSATFQYGLTSSYPVTGKLGVGFFLQRYGIGSEFSEDSSSASLSQTQLSWGAESHWYPSDGLSGFDLGLRLGFTSITRNATATSSVGTVTIAKESSSFVLAPRVGYDVRFGRFSAGGEISYALTGERVFSLLVTGKFWF
jgi:hypothetical protein